jgi:Leucine-rich repeat (LRR) protein
VKLFNLSLILYDFCLFNLCSILKNCNISGQIPTYLSHLKELETLDLSFNKLVGGIPSFAQAENLRFIILAGNMLEGDAPDELLRDGITVDLSYNNLKWQSPESRACRPNMNLNLNLFQSTSTKKSSKFLPCIKDFKCPRCKYTYLHNSDLFANNHIGLIMIDRFTRVSHLKIETNHLLNCLLL